MTFFFLGVSWCVRPTIALGYLCPGLCLCSTAVNECVEVSDNHWSSVFTQHHLSKGCPCQDFFQPCGHEETVDSSLEIFKLQSFILALELLDDDIARSAVTVEGDRVDRDLGSLR